MKWSFQLLFQDLINLMRIWDDWLKGIIRITKEIYQKAEDTLIYSFYLFV